MGTESGIRNMTVGSPFRHILMFTLPLLAGNFLQQFYNMVDSWVVGNFVSDGALAAVGVGFPVIFLFTSLFSGIATGGTVVIAQSFGGGRPDRVRSAIDSLYTAFIRSILPITAAALLLVNPLMTVLRVDPAAWAETRTYLLVVCAGLVGSIGYNLNAGILGGMGNSSTTLLFLAVSTILNIFLDLALVLAVPLGVLGVARGPVPRQCAAALLTVASITGTPACYRFDPKKLGFDPEILGQVVRIGLPAGLQSVMYSVSNIVVQASVNGFGTDVVAAYTAYGKIDSVFWMTMSSFGLSITTFVGQNFGAKQYGRVKKGVLQCAGMAFAATALLMALVLPLGSWVYRFFVPDQTVIHEGLRILHFLVPVWPTYVLIEVLSGAVRGTGDSLIPMLMTSFGVCVLRIVWIVAVALPFWPSLNGVLTCYPLSWAFTSVLFLAYYLQGGWLRRRIRVQEAAETAPATD